MSAITTDRHAHWRSYVPELLKRRLAAPEGLLAPEAQVADAVLLLSDIEGFSARVARAAEGGRGGLESLSARLDAYFVRLAEIVHAHGGDVLFVAGDAFLCLFEPERPGAEALREMALRAAAASLRIQADVAVMQMPTRIGLAAGPVARGLVGGHAGRWEIVLGGDALAEAIEAERSAPAGGVHAGAGCAAALDGSVVLAADAGPSRRLMSLAAQVPPLPLPAAARPDPQRLRPYLPPIVEGRAMLVDPAAMAEFRTVSVVLADLPPLVPGDARSLERLHAAVLAFQRAVARSEGTLKVDVDDKGVLLLGAFGLPARSHEDNADRAVRTALAYAGGPDAQVGGSVAVTTGRAFCGFFGSERRREYMVRGEFLNLAARLAGLPGEGVLCDRATVRAARSEAGFEALGERMVRGRAQPVPVWRAGGLAAAARNVASPALFGREAECALLEAALDDAVAGRAVPVMIEGEAGIGKSRLVAELLGSGLRRGMRVLRGRATAADRGTAYHAWRPVVRQLLGLADGVPRAALATRLAEALASAPGGADAAPLVGDVLGIALPETPRTAQLHGEVRAENTLALLVELLGRDAAASPTLLVLEDLHWFDSASARLLAAVVRAALPMLCAVTMRPAADADDDTLRELRERCAGRLIQLQPLGAADIGQLMAHRLGLPALPPTLVDFVSARVGGHPYFCEEFISAMLESGALRVEQGGCIVDDRVALELPTTVEGTIVSRIDALHEAEQLCLKIGAVVGHRFTQATLAAAHPLEAERPRVGERLNRICRSELTQTDATTNGPTWRFKHQITRDVAYGLMTDAQRQPLHAGVAKALEAAHAGDGAAPHPVLALHWALAGQPARAVDHYERAGDAALHAGAFAEALRFFRRAEETAAASRQLVEAWRHARWIQGVGTAHYFLGDLQASRESLERAVAIMDRAVPQGRAAGTASLRELGWQALQALGLGGLRRRPEAPKATLDGAVDIYRTLGQIYYLDGLDMGRVTYVTLRGVNVGEAAGPSPGLARVLANTGSMMGWLGLDRWSDAYTARAVAMASAGGQTGAQAYVWNIAAITQAQRGRWSAALEANQRALELVQRIGDHNLEAEVWIVRATVHDCAGDVAALAQDWPQARALAEQRRNPQILCWSLLDECDACLGAGDTAGAASALDRALAIPTAPNDGSSTIDKAQALAGVRLRQGRHAEAAAAVREVVELVTRQPPSGYHWVAFLANAAEVAIELLPVDPSLRPDALRAVRALEKLSGRFRNVLPRSRWLRAGLLEGSAARRKLQEALRLAQTMDMPFERARAQAALARLGAGDGRDALATFERLGARVEADRLRAALAV